MFPAKYRIPMIQLKDHMKFNKKKGPSEDTSIPLRRGKKIIMRDKVKEAPGWEMEGKWKRGRGSGMGDMGEKPRGPAEYMEICSRVREWEVGGP